MARVDINVTPRSRRLVDRMQTVRRRLVPAIDKALGQITQELATAVRRERFEPYRPGLDARDGYLRMRSRMLRNALTAGRHATMRHWVGVPARTPAGRYAYLLGEQTKTIRPVSAQNLWIPIGDNLRADGTARYTPRQAMELPGVFIHRTRSDHAVVLRRVNGNLRRLFVLKKQVEVSGRRVILDAAEQRADRMRQVLSDHLRGALAGDADG